MPSSHLPPTAFVLFLQNHDQIGNRAFGERLTSLVQPAALEAAIALMLLCPQIPLLFMGEECASRTPFLFFTDHGAELADAVREGRRGEFAKFPTFADPASRERIPDPNAPETYCRLATAGRRFARGSTRGAVPAPDRTARDGDRAATGWRALADGRGAGTEGRGGSLAVGRRRGTDAGEPISTAIRCRLVRQRANCCLPTRRCRGVCCPVTAPAPSSLNRGPPMTDDAIRDLARRAGIAVEWNDYAGRPMTVAPEVLRHMLRALGLPCATRGDVLASRRLLQRRSTVQELPPLITATAGRPIRLDVGASEPRSATTEP